jgi:CheY-like chemotaxis protein
MEKLRVAIVEDNKELLKDLKNNLEETGLVNVIAWATSSYDILNHINLNQAEALLLDIDLGGDSMSGLDIANKLKLPVLFVSGKTRDFFLEIEQQNIDAFYVVEHLTKPITLEKLNKILPKFIRDIKTEDKSNYIYIDFKESKRNKIRIDTIVCIETCTGKEGESNNKRMYFTDRKSESLIDFSYTQMEAKGFNHSKFIIPHRSFRLNNDSSWKYDKLKHEIEVMVFETFGDLVSKIIPVSENYRSDILKIRK